MVSIVNGSFNSVKRLINTAPKYKLTYFPIKGLGEPIRFLLAYLGKDYEDFRFNRDDWPKIKPTTPWGKSPVFDIEGKPVTQSMAITRYLGREAGLNGKDAWEDLKIDEIAGVVDDLRSELAIYGYEEDEKKKEALKGPLLNEIVPFYMKRLDAHVKANNGYLANGKLSWADLHFAALSDYLSYLHGSDLVANYPNVKALREKVYALPKIKAWVDKRPNTDS